MGGTAPLQTVNIVIAEAGHPCVGGMAFFTKVQEAALALFASAIGGRSPALRNSAGEIVQLLIVEVAMGWLVAMVRLAAMEMINLGITRTTGIQSFWGNMELCGHPINRRGTWQWHKPSQ